MHKVIVSIFVFCFLLVGCSKSLKNTPPEVLAAAERAVPGIVLVSAKKINSYDGEAYEVTGKFEGRKYYIEVGLDGKSRKISW